MCHDPPVSNEAVKDEDAPWFCLECSQKRARKSAPKTPAAVPDTIVLNTEDPISHDSAANEPSPSFSNHANFINAPYGNAHYINAPYNNAAFTTNGPYAGSVAFPNSNGFPTETPLSLPTASPSPRLMSWENRSSEDVSLPSV